MSEEAAVSEPAIVNPVIKPDLDFSKNTFNEAMAVEKSKVEEASKEPETTEPVKEEPKVEPKIEPTEIVRPETVEKAKLPEELLTGKQPEPKVDDAVAEIDAMVLPKNAKPEQVASFAKLKEHAKKVIDERTARIAQLESKTSEGASRAEIEAANERVKTAETKAKELESTIERIAFTESPRFKQFINDETATLQGAKSYFEGTEINPEIVELAARTSGAQRIKVLREAGADAELIGAVTPYLAEYDKIQRYKAGALENWKAESAQMAENQKAQQQAEQARRAAAEDKVWDEAFSELKDVAAYRKFDSQDAWNERSDKLKSEWKRIYNGSDVDLKEVAVTIGKGMAYDAEHEIRMTVTDELNKALQENAKLKAAKPGAGNGQVATTTTSDENLSPMDAAKKRFNAELAKATGG